MMRDELKQSAGQRMITMALLAGDYSEKYYTNHAEIHSIACIGHILRHEVLPDGKFNLILRGLSRVRIIEEDRTGDYRRAKVEPIVTVAPLAADQTQHDLRAQLRDVLCSSRFECLAKAIRYEDWFDTIPCLGHLTDLLTFYILQNHVDIKQELLKELDNARRAKMLLNFLEGLTPPVPSTPTPRQSWPPRQNIN
jgi:Lon protease-like protein